MLCQFRLRWVFGGLGYFAVAGCFAQGGSISTENFLPSNSVACFFKPFPPTVDITYVATLENPGNRYESVAGNGFTIQANLQGGGTVIYIRPKRSAGIGVFFDLFSFVTSTVPTTITQTVTREVITDNRTPQEIANSPKFEQFNEDQRLEVDENGQPYWLYGAVGRVVDPSAAPTAGFEFRSTGTDGTAQTWTVKTNDLLEPGYFETTRRFYSSGTNPPPKITVNAIYRRNAADPVNSAFSSSSFTPEVRVESKATLKPLKRNFTIQSRVATLGVRG